jgi:hypothetical protein
MPFIQIFTPDGGGIGGEIRPLIRESEQPVSRGSRPPLADQRILQEFAHQGIYGYVTLGGVYLGLAD